VSTQFEKNKNDKQRLKPAATFLTFPLSIKALKKTTEKAIFMNKAGSTTGKRDLWEKLLKKLRLNIIGSSRIFAIFRKN